MKTRLTFIILVLLSLCLLTVPACTNKHIDAEKMLNIAFATPAEIQTILAEGINVNAKDEEGRTPLMYVAMYNKNPEALTTLIDAGADVNAKDNFGETPLFYS